MNQMAMTVTEDDYLTARDEQVSVGYSKPSGRCILDVAMDRCFGGHHRVGLVTWKEAKGDRGFISTNAEALVNAFDSHDEALILSMLPRVITVTRE